MPLHLPLHSFRNAIAASTPSPRDRAFALPSSLQRKNQEFPPPRGRREKHWLDPRPSPSRGKTARRQARGHPSSLGWLPTPQPDQGPPLSEGRVILSFPQPWRKNRGLLPATPSPSGAGSSGVAHPPTQPFPHTHTHTGQEPTSFLASQDAEQPPFSSAG